MDIETTGLEPWYESVVTCIGAKSSDGDKFCMAHKNEIAVITHFMEWVEQQQAKDEFVWVTKNGMHFDMPFLMARITQLNLPRMADYRKTLLEVEHIDLQKITHK
jgi:uncharacterized protein YprB with RNaseH-like and TPR domain